jgi:dUTPase
MAKDKIKFLKVRDVKSPTRAYEFDAGIDFYIPEFTKEFLEDLADKNQGRDLEMRDVGINPYVVIPAHSRIMIPAGIKCRMAEPGRALIAANKSGVAVKTGLIVGACVDKETIIETNKGKFKVETLTKKFISDNDIKIKGYDEITKKFNYYNFDGFRNTGARESIKLFFDNGDELICSNDHLILTETGWKAAKDINEKDEIINANL